jgi:hypothetical protein
MADEFWNLWDGSIVYRDYPSAEACAAASAMLAVGWLAGKAVTDDSLVAEAAAQGAEFWSQADEDAAEDPTR